jgi:hypothetical protein
MKFGMEIELYHTYKVDMKYLQINKSKYDANMKF